MRQLIAGATAATALVVAGCGVGQKVLDKSDVEKNAKDELTKTVGKAPQAVSCPKDLDARVGSSERCTLTDDQGIKLGMTVTVKKVNGDNAIYEVAVDNQ